MWVWVTPLKAGQLGANPKPTEEIRLEPRWYWEYKAQINIRKVHKV